MNAKIKVSLITTLLVTHPQIPQNLATQKLCLMNY